MHLSEMIKRSLVTEKTLGLVDKNVFSLVVDLEATKLGIKQAVEKAFAVKVDRVRTLVVRGRTVRRAISKKARPIEVKKANFKKAYVTLKEGYAVPQVIPQQDPLPVSAT